MDNSSYIQTEVDSTKTGTIHKRVHCDSQNSMLRYERDSNACNERRNDIKFYPHLQKIFQRAKKRRSSLPTAILDQHSRIGLKQSIGSVSCIGILVGGIIGSGIFISPKGVLQGSGSIGLAFIVWITCGFISLMGSLAYAELGMLMPNSGGQYFYMVTAFDPRRKEEKSMWRSIPPFLYFWQVTLLSKPATVAVQGMAIADYLMQLFSLGGCTSTISKEKAGMFVKLMSALFIITIAFTNAYSNKLSTRMINVFTFIKLLALVVIIVSGVVELSKGTNEALKTGFEGTTLSFDGLTTSFYSGLWACSGWDSLNMVTKELMNPKRDLLRSLIITSALVTTVYLLANMAYFAVLSKEAFLASDAVAVDYAKLIAGKAGAVYVIISVASSIFGSSVGGNFTHVRLSYAAAREGHMADFFSYIDHKRMTPTVALVFSAFLSLLMLPQSNILGLIALTGFLDWIFMFLTMVALLVFRKTVPSQNADFKVPTIIPYIVMIFSLFLVVTPFINHPKMEYIFVLVLLLAGVVVYIVFVYHECRIPGLGKIKVLVQKVLLVLPSEDEDV